MFFKFCAYFCREKYRATGLREISLWYVKRYVVVSNPKRVWHYHREWFPFRHRVLTKNGNFPVADLHGMGETTWKRARSFAKKTPRVSRYRADYRSVPTSKYPAAHVSLVRNVPRQFRNRRRNTQFNSPPRPYISFRTVWKSRTRLKTIWLPYRLKILFKYFICSNLIRIFTFKHPKEFEHRQF